MVHADQEFYGQIDKGEWAPFYVLTGDESYLIRQAFQYLKSKALQEHELDFNYEVFEGAEFHFSKLYDSYQTWPMMAARRLLVIRNAQDLSDSQWEEVMSLFERPIETSMVVILAAELDKRKKFYKTLQQKAKIIEFKQPYDSQIPSWIRHLAHQMGLEIEDQAIHELHRRIGSSLENLETSLKTLKDYIGSEKVIHFESVEAVFTVHREETVFEWIDWVAQKNKFEALASLQKNQEQGQSELGMVALLSRHLRILYQLKKQEKAGVRGPKLAQALQVPPYFLNKYQGAAQHWTESDLEQSFVVLNQTDRVLKSSSISSAIWMESLVFKLCESAPPKG